MTDHSPPALRRWSMTAVILFLALPAALGSARAQGAGCRSTAYTDPPREVLTCADGLSISAEKGGDYRVIERGGRPAAVELKGKAILIEVPPGRRNGFQILTPHAIASVRGTTWAVDVAGAKTSVFVRSGRVGVTRPGDRAGVVLGPGDGIDVGPTGPLTVTTWSRERGLHLLARFGR